MKKFLLAVLFFSVIYGDVMYEIETKTSGPSEWGEVCMAVRNFLKRDKMRIEIKSEGQSKDTQTLTTIFRIDRGVIWILNTDKKEFTEIALKDELPTINPDTNSVLSDLKIERTQEKKHILKIECEKYIVSLKVDSGEEKFEVNQVMWVARDFVGYSEIKEFNKRAQDYISQYTPPGLENRLLKNLQKRILEIDGIPLEVDARVRIENDKENLEINISSIFRKISTVPISDRVFEIPEDYKPAPILRNLME
ncbi:MAG: DUF4412 domain-containing protein [candidate division WOR-3 bacterium]|nr:DUF4412 domain-containing protein [candidate division WOR-3 bacterium]